MRGANSAAKRLYFHVKPGDVTGVLPFSQNEAVYRDGRALTDGRVLRFPASLVSRTRAEDAGVDASVSWV